MALLKEVCYQGWAVRIKNPTPLKVSSLSLWFSVFLCLTVSLLHTLIFSISEYLSLSPTQKCTILFFCIFLSFSVSIPLCVCMCELVLRLDIISHLMIPVQFQPACCHAPCNDGHRLKSSETVRPYILDVFFLKVALFPWCLETVIEKKLRH